MRGAATLAASALRVAQTQSTSIPGERLAARLVADLATAVMTLDAQIKQIDQLIEERFRRHPAAEVIISMPGIGVLLGAEFLAATGADLDASAPLIAWPALPAWHRYRVTPAASPATCTVPAATTAACNACSTPRP